MANVFKVSEIVDIGIEKEKARRDFYDLTSRQFPQKEMSELFLRLRDWETQHIEKFTRIRAGLDEAEPVEAHPGEFAAYMQSLVDEKLYREVSVENFSRNIKGPLDAIQYGIGFEKDAILFFNELRGFVSVEYQKVINSLVDEEKQHIVYLSELKKKLALRS
jgi:rubrerythrin